MEQKKANKNTSKRKWKDENEEYLMALQKFFDATDNIKDKDLRKRVVFQMLKCDEILTKIAEENFEKQGIKKKNNRTLF